MLLPGNGTNGAQNNTFLDSSTNNFSITRNGNTTQGTFAPYGANWSNYFDGTGGWLSAPSNTAFDFGTGDYTIEAWVYQTARSTDQVPIFQTAGTNANGLSVNIDASNGNLTVYSNAAFIISSSSSALSLNTWAHVAFTRASGTTRAFLDGAQVGSSSTSYTPAFTDPRIGINASFTSARWNGYISNLRVLKGTALYTAAFTPPTAPLTAITNTSLLTCQSNRFIDNSANNFTITRNGDVSVQVFSPFSPTASYDAGTNGGSGYFDGTGDYLSIADNAALELGSSNFCIENWFYQQANSSRSIVNKRANSSSYGLSIFAQNASNSVEVYISSNGSSWDIVNGTSLGTIIPSAWNHVALYRSGNSWYGAMNGTVTLLTTNSSAVVNNSSAWNFGAESDGFGVTGYLADGRIVIGSAVYGASNFTPPTTPLTAITNTQLLLNYTNAGVIDNAMMNNLETVGNAQISTTQSKWGGSSIAFDGTGDYLVGASNPQIAVGSGDFTIEMWIYLTANFDGTGQGLVTAAYNTNFAVIGVNGGAGNRIEFYVVNSVLTSGTNYISLNTWTHLAFTRASGTTKIFFNGNQVASSTSLTGNGAAAPVYVGTLSHATGQVMTGYLDDLRITKGFARYTANFTVPTAPFPTR
jgi:hypothetical protein